jgi:hypothetical protein
MKPAQVDAVGRGARPRPVNPKEQAMQNQASLRRKAVFAAAVAVLFSLPTLSGALAQGRNASEYSPTSQCKVIDSISGRCLTFDSDSTWPEGLPDYHGSNGG